MNFKSIFTSLCAVGVTVASCAYAASDADLANLQNQLNQLQARVDALSASKGGSMGALPYIATYAPLTQEVNGVQPGVGRERAILADRKSGKLADGMVYVGGYARASAMYEKVSSVPSGSNTNTAFDHVTNAKSDSTNTSQSASQLMLPRVDLDVVANVNSWITGFVNLESLAISGNGNNNIDMQRAYVLLGDMSKTPFYGILGKNTVDFGSFETVNFDTIPLDRTMFRAKGNVLGVGYQAYGLQASVSAINGNGGAGANTVQNTYTKDANGINNFALNLKYGMNTSGASWDVGAGYLNGARDKFSTSNAAKETTGAWDVNGRVGYAGFDLLAEYVSTIDNVYDTTATTAQNRLFAWDIGADYNFPLMGKASAVNVDYSRAKQAVAASQWVIGFRNETFNNVWMGLEYSSSKGAIYNDGTSSIYNPSIAAQPIATSGYDGISNSTLLFDVTAMF